MCTSVVWADNKIATVSARNMDWLEDMETDVWVFPAGQERVGLAVEGENSLNWTSKYGSVVASTYGIATADGVNEKGLGMHLLWLVESDYGQRNADLPGLALSLWGQFYLDLFASVDEAVEYTKKNPFQLATAGFGSKQQTGAVHLKIEDGSGDVAIFEYIDGELQIYHDKKYRVLTNSPSFDQQLKNLEHYDGFGGNKPLPGTTLAADRFVRASFYLDHLRTPSTLTETIAGVVSVARNAAQPNVVPDPEQPNISPTIWRTAIDHTHLVYYFESTTSPYLLWLDMSKLDFSSGAPLLRLPINGNPPFLGEVSHELVQEKEFTWMMPS